MITFSWRRSMAIAKKEVYHIMRDPFTLGAAIGLPIFMVLIFGLAIEFNVKNIPTAVYDADQTQTSRQLVETFYSSEYFIMHEVMSPEKATSEIITNNVRAALMIPPYFQRDVFAGRGGEVQILLDGSDSSTVVPILGYVGAIQDLAAERIANYKVDLPYEMRARFLFNPELNSRWFVIPGLNVVVMSILSILLTALTIASEYERGSMELLLSTPVQPIEIIVGKVAPYGCLGLLAIALIYVMARVFFGVPFIGSHLVFLLGTILFLLAYLAQGALISTLARNQLLALQFAVMTGMLPTQLLSGFIFPIESMPNVIQYFTALLPARWFMEISRDSFLQGTTINALWTPLLAMALFCAVIISLTVKSFKRNVEP